MVEGMDGDMDDVKAVDNDVEAVDSDLGVVNSEGMVSDLWRK